MSSQTQTIEHAPTAPPPQASGGFQVSERLRDCAAKLREHLRSPAASHWLKDNHALLESHIADLRHALRSSFVRKLHQNSEGEPRIYRIVTGWLANAPGVIDTDVLLPFAEVLRETEALEIRELWAFAPMLKFAIVERLCASLDSERVVAASIRTLWAIEAISWKAFVEAASRTEAALRQDPAGVYSRMDLATRDRYLLELNRVAKRANLSEEDVAKAALEKAEQARDAGNSDPRTFHVGYYLVGPGAKDFRSGLGCKRSAPRFSGGLDGTLSDRFLRRRRGGPDGAADVGIRAVGRTSALVDTRAGSHPSQPGCARNHQCAVQPDAQSALHSQHGFPGCHPRRFENHGGGAHAAALGIQLREAAQGHRDSLSGEPGPQSGVRSADRFCRCRGGRDRGRQCFETVRGRHPAS